MKKFETSQRALLRILTPVIFTAILLVACDDNGPEKEDTPELITQVSLTFTPLAGGAAVTGIATDPDGQGIQDMTVNDTIQLDGNTAYLLTISLINGLADPSSAAYDVSQEVEREGDEHLFFFAWSDQLFENPVGDGNLDNRTDEVEYRDSDVDGLPVGLITEWTTDVEATGTFRVVLKHQPDLKSDTSGSDVGESDLDIEFVIAVE